MAAAVAATAAACSSSGSGLQQRRRQPAEDCGSDGGNELVRYTNELVLSLGDKKEDVAPNPL